MTRGTGDLSPGTERNRSVGIEDDRIETKDKKTGGQVIGDR